MVVVFVIDTGASMGRSCADGFSCLDLAKCAVEVFVKQCIAAGKGNETFALVDARDDESCMKCMIGDPYSAFEDAYKSLQADSESSLNYAISAAFTMLNQHRIKDGIETFGQGRIPWLLQPATCVLLTDGACFRGNNELAVSRSSHAFAELVKEPFRWDQKLFTVLIQAEEDSGVDPPASLVNLSEMTGGDIFTCQNLKALTPLMKPIVGKVQQSKVVVSISHDVNAPFHTKECMAEMIVKAQGNWPLPEGYWLDRSMDQLPMRTAHPRFVYKPIIENAEAIATAFDIAKKLEFPVDQYELRWLKPSTHTPSNSIKSMKYTVHVPMSGKVAGLGEPIGVLRPSKVPGIFELTVFPYDFVGLMALLRQAAESARSAAHMQTLSAALSPQWKQEFNAYLYNIPPYYYAPMRRALHRFGITFPGEGRNDGGLTRGLAKRLQRIQEAAIVDIQRVEQARRRGCTLPEDPIIAATRPLSLPTSARDVRADDLLLQWESVRKALFGGTGFTVQGLFVKGIPGKGGYCSGTDPRGRATTPESNLFAACGGHAVPQRKIRDMSNYTEVLARMEAPRDPDNPQPDEDAPQGILRRKLNVHFGNPFRTSKKSAVDVDAPSSLHIDETAEEVAALFMDTPAPHREAQFEESPPPAHQAIVKDATSSTGRLTIPPLGKPPLRKRKRPLAPAKSREVEEGETPIRPKAGIAATAEAKQQQQQQQPQQRPQSPAGAVPPASPQSVAESAQLSPRSNETLATGPPMQRQRIEKEEIQPMSLPQPMKLAAPAAASVSPQAVSSPVATAAPEATETQLAAQSQSQPQAQPQAQPQQTPQELPLPAGWVKHFSKREQQYYFFNTNTGESSWVRPT